MSPAPMPPATIFNGFEAYAECTGRAARPGGVKSQEAKGYGDRGGGVLARGQQNSLKKGEDGRSVRGEGWLCRWHAASPAHPPAVPVHQRVDAKAFLHRRRPAQPPGLSQPFLPEQREHRIAYGAKKRPRLGRCWSSLLRPRVFLDT